MKLLEANTSLVSAMKDLKKVCEPLGSPRARKTIKRRLSKKSFQLQKKTKEIVTTLEHQKIDLQKQFTFWNRYTEYLKIIEVMFPRKPYETKPK